MRNAELLRSALQSLRANPKRSFLTTIGITIGIAAVITILALGNGVKKRLSDEFNTTQNGEQYTYLYFTPNDSQSAASGFTETDLNAIEERFGAKVKKAAISHETNNASVSPLVGNERVNNATISLFKRPTSKISIIAGRNLTTNELLTEEPVILMKESLAKKQYQTVQNAVGTSVSIGDHDYRVVGVYRSQANTYNDNKYGADLIGGTKLFYSGTTATTGYGIKLTFYQGANAGKVTKKIKKYMDQEIHGKEGNQRSRWYLHGSRCRRGTDQSQQHDYRFDGLYQCHCGDLAVYRWDWGHEHDVHLGFGANAGNRDSAGRWGRAAKRDGPVLVRSHRLNGRRRVAGLCHRLAAGGHNQ